jgi:hypothetical protein
LLPQQRITNADREMRPPWSPVAISIISFLFPAGGAVLTIQNLRRLRQLDAPTARQMTYAIVGIFALGFGLLLLLAGGGTKGKLGVNSIDPNAATALSIGIAAASYVVQRLPFRSWRTSNAQTRTSPWLGALGMAVLYEIVVAFCAVPVLVAGLLVNSAGLVGFHL